MFEKIKALRSVLRRLAALSRQVEQLQLAVGRIEMRQTARAESLDQAEFQVYSQWGEDGIIEYLLNRVSIERDLFVEFGVESYLEANTRFLLKNRNWRGLVIDGSEDNIRAIRADPISWRHDLNSVNAFIDAANINSLLEDNGVTGDIGLLSIDIDGNDYWVWRALEIVSPRIVICEFNGIFGAKSTVTVPYDPEFTRWHAHYSGVLAGASLGALAFLAVKKGYRLVGVNRAGNNAFFVREDIGGLIPAVSPEVVFKEPRFREARDRGGKLALVDLESARAMIKDAQVEDVRTGERIRVGDLPV